MSSWPGVEVFLEQVDLWRNVDGVNLYDKYRDDPHRWSTTFQTYVFKTRTSQILFLVDEKHLVNNFSGKDCLHQK